MKCCLVFTACGVLQATVWAESSRGEWCRTVTAHRVWQSLLTLSSHLLVTCGLRAKTCVTRAVIYPSEFFTQQLRRGGGGGKMGACILGEAPRFSLTTWGASEATALLGHLCASHKLRTSHDYLQIIRPGCC